jgi:DNA-binding GntR family transcriptional regulator
MIKRKSSVPMYQQISKFLKQQIIEGVYSEGTKIPTEIELMEQFDVSRTTVRLAIKEIMNENLVEAKPGKGTFVLKGKVYHHLEGFKGLYETLLEAGISPETELLDFRKEEASPDICQALKLKNKTKVLKVLRLYHVDGHPIALAQISLHSTLSDLITLEEARNHPIYQLFAEKTGFKVKQAHFEIFAENASSKVAEALQIKENDAVLGAERILYTEQGKPVEHTLLWFRSDAYRFTLALERGTKLQMSDLNQFRLTVNQGE